MGGLDGVVSLIAGPAYDSSNLSLLNETAPIHVVRQRFEASCSRLPA
jgi:hypothetical protein